MGLRSANRIQKKKRRSRFCDMPEIYFNPNTILKASIGKKNLSVKPLCLRIGGHNSVSYYCMHFRSPFDTIQLCHNAAGRKFTQKQVKTTVPMGLRRCIDRFISVKMARRYPVNSLLKFRIGLNQTNPRTCRTSSEDFQRTWRRLRVRRCTWKTLMGGFLKKIRYQCISIDQ